MTLNSIALLNLRKTQIGLSSGVSTKRTNLHLIFKIILLGRKINFSDQINGKILELFSPNFPMKGKLSRCFYFQKVESDMSLVTT